jgi:signal transduction histidine kinase
VADHTAFFSVEPAVTSTPTRTALIEIGGRGESSRARLIRAPRHTSPVASGEAVSAPDLPSGYEGLRVGFTAAVSHELRTPLARLLSLLDTAKLPGVDVRELIDEACAEVVEMTQLVDDILFLSELEQGREVVALGFTELAPHVRELYELSRERALRAELTLEMDVPDGLVVPLRPRMLQVVLTNLLDNALRYAGRGATFRFGARGLRDTVLLGLRRRRRGRSLGCPRLFRRFFRSDRSRARGLGLGLAIVKHRDPRRRHGRWKAPWATARAFASSGAAHVPHPLSSRRSHRPPDRTVDTARVPRDVFHEQLERLEALRARAARAANCARPSTLCTAATST